MADGRESVRVDQTGESKVVLMAESRDILTVYLKAAKLDKLSAMMMVD